MEIDGKEIDEMTDEEAIQELQELCAQAGAVYTGNSVVVLEYTDPRVLLQLRIRLLDAMKGLCMSCWVDHGTQHEYTMYFPAHQLMLKWVDKRDPNV